jgi:hypothetical protein
VYVEEFETFLLDATTSFYHEESAEQLSRHSAPEYLTYAGAWRARGSSWPGDYRPRG